MRVAVLGSGLIGVTTALFLRRAGHEVLVVDCESGPGRGASFANGALLTPSMSDPWNAPGSWRALLSSLVTSGSAAQIRWRALPSLISWGATFLRNSVAPKFEKNAGANLRLGLYSLRVLQQLRQQVELHDDCAPSGSLRIFRSEYSLERAHNAALRREREGLACRFLSRTELIELEPALGPIALQLAGALYFPIDEVGDAHRFCVELARIAVREGVEFRFATEILGFETQRGAVTAAILTGERVHADQYVVAAGSYSPILVRAAGVRLPVRPAKGYSVTFDAVGSGPRLRIPVIDDDLHAAVVPLRDRLRVAGMAEFAGYDLELDPERVDRLVRLLGDLMPRGTYDRTKEQAWCGLRPMSADGVPIIGPTPLPNLWVNTGHGHLGWTLAAGSGQLLSDLISGVETGIESESYSLSRFE